MLIITKGPAWTAARVKAHAAREARFVADIKRAVLRAARSKPQGIVWRDIVAAVKTTKYEVTKNGPTQWLDIHHVVGLLRMEQKLRLVGALHIYVPYAPCPWCRKEMEVGGEDPITERICEACAALPPAQLKKLNPTFHAKYTKRCRAEKR